MDVEHLTDREKDRLQAQLVVSVAKEDAGFIQRIAEDNERLEAAMARIYSFVPDGFGEGTPKERLLGALSDIAIAAHTALTPNEAPTTDVSQGSGPNLVQGSEQDKAAPTTGEQE